VLLVSKNVDARRRTGDASIPNTIAENGLPISSKLENVWPGVSANILGDGFCSANVPAIKFCQKDAFLAVQWASTISLRGLAAWQCVLGFLALTGRRTEKEPTFIWKQPSAFLGSPGV